MCVDKHEYVLYVLYVLYDDMFDEYTTFSNL